MRVSFYIAKRYLLSNKSRNAINIISWISVISVSIGTAALVIVLSAFNGLESLVESLFESFDPDIRIEAKQGKVFTEDEFPFEKLDEIDGVLYTKVLEEVCGVRYKENDVIATLKGVEDSYLQMSRMDSNLIDGQAILVENEIPYAICGYGLASQLKLNASNAIENLKIYSPKREISNSANPYESVYQKLISASAIFYISPEYDFKYILVPLSFIQDFLELEKKISAVELNVADKRRIPLAKENLEAVLGDKYEVKSRYEFNEIIYKTNKTEKWVTFLILTFILIIASFNILSSLSMLIIDKKKDILTLRNLGLTKAGIRKIFFLEGLLINLSGAIIGLTLGVIVCVLQQKVGLLRLEGGIVEYYPVQIELLELVYILVTVMVIGLLTSWYPVRKLTVTNFS